MRIPFVAANWKMHKTVEEALSYTEIFQDLLPTNLNVEIVLAVPFTALHPIAKALSGTKISVAGQDLHWEIRGAYTGEISGDMIRETGATHVVIGHSERRHIFGETDSDVNFKVKAAIRSSLVPIICTGETLEERTGNQTMAVLDRQIETGLKGLNSDQVSNCIVAYEPVWAIGTGQTATPDQVQEVHGHIRSHLAQLFGQNASQQCRVIYGGSVKPANVFELSAQPDVDGSLVGGAGLDPESFADIVEKST